MNLGGESGGEEWMREKLWLGCIEDEKKNKKERKKEKPMKTTRSSLAATP